MAEPWRHSETGTYYLRRQIFKTLRDEFGGKQLWKRSLETKDASDARTVFTVINAELKRTFAAAREAIAERCARDVLTPEAAAKAVARIAAVKTGSKYDGYPVLGNIFWSEEAASTMLGGVRIAMVMTFIDREPTDDIDTTVLPGDVWLRSVPTRLRPDMKLGELLDAWKSKTPTPGAQGAHETATTVTDFIDYFGNVAVSRITGDHLYNFRDAVASLPKAMPRVDRNLGFNARLAKYQGHDEIKVAPASIKRRIGHIQALLTYAFSQRWIEHNTGSGIPIEGYAKNMGGRRPFLDDELALLFASPLLLRPGKWSFARDTVSDMTLAWFFLLGLTNGARIEEIGQIDLANVKIDGGVRYLDLGPDAKVKNEGSRRMIPLHKAIVDLGFDDYVAALRMASAPGSRRLAAN